MSGSRFCIAALLVISACSTPPAANAPGVEARPQDERASRIATSPYVITQAEMMNPVVTSMDALKGIRYLRPSFFRNSGPQSFSNPDAGQVQMSMDFGPLQSVNQLTTLNIGSLYEVRYLDASAAATRFGLNANGGPVIVVLSNRQP